MKLIRTVKMKFPVYIIRNDAITEEIHFFCKRQINSYRHKRTEYVDRIIEVYVQYPF